MACRASLTCPVASSNSGRWNSLQFIILNGASPNAVFQKGESVVASECTVLVVFKWWWWWLVMFVFLQLRTHQSSPARTSDSWIFRGISKAQIQNLTKRSAYSQNSKILKILNQKSEWYKFYKPIQLIMYAYSRVVWINECLQFQWVRLWWWWDVRERFPAELIYRASSNQFECAFRAMLLWCTLS